MGGRFGPVHKLTAADEAGDFDCGQQELNLFLQRYALVNQRANSAQTYVSCVDDAVVGYYSLCVGSVGFDEAPHRVVKGLARHRVPVMLLARLGVETFIRVGTTGSIQEDLHLGDVVINTASVRMDGASRAYAPIEFPAAADMDTVLALREAAKESGIPFKTGISISTDSFWPGQERYDSFGGYVLKRLQGSLEDFRHLGCTNYEMENATLFTLCAVLGLKAASICGVVAKRTDSESVAPHEVYEKAEKRFQKVVKRALEKMIAHSRSGENIS